MVATLSDKTPDLNDILKLFSDRLGNEITRAAAVVAVGVIAEARVDLRPILSDTVKKLASFLRKANRALKTATIHSLSGERRDEYFLLR